MKSQQGSVLLLALFVCAAVTSLVLAGAAVVTAVERGLWSEKKGRELLERLESNLEEEVGRQAADWGPGTRDETEGGAGGVRIIVSEVPAEVPDSGNVGAEATLQVAVLGQTGNATVREVSAQLERGRDGLDLPLAAIVARTLRSRSPAGALAAESGSEPVALSLEEIEEWGTFYPGARIESNQGGWRLDAGNLLRLGAAGFERGGSRVIHFAAGPGQTVKLADLLKNTPPAAADDPLFREEEGYLVVVSGGATLHARELGALSAVLISDGGDIELDGTLVRGAVFATGLVDLGDSGTVLFSRQVLRWATDRSLRRVRVVPGSRRERFVTLEP